MRRSMLFLPGNSPNILLNADFLGSDAIILDLEDAVAPTEKDSARILVRNAITSLGYTREVIVRINPIDSPYWQKDLEEIIKVKPDMIKSLFGMISGFSIKRTATMVKGIFTKEDLLEINAKLNKIKKK